MELTLTNETNKADAELELSVNDIHDVLRNSRRRHIIERLEAVSQTVTVRELAEHIAEQETDQSPPPKNIRQSAYVSLHQTHLPKLNDLGIVAYDATNKEVRLTELAAHVQAYMNVESTVERNWSEFYLGVGVLGLLVSVGHSVGVPVMTAVSVRILANFFLLVVIFAALYHNWIQRRGSPMSFGE